MEYYKKHKKGIIGTIIFHTIILLILLFLGFFTPLPLPGEEGILVNFGNSENGFGDREPSPARRNPKPVQSVQKEKPQPKQEEVTPPVATPPPPKTSTPKTQPAKEVAMTQDFEETAAIDAAEKKKREEEKKQQQLEDDRLKKQQEEDRIKKEEEDRIRKQQEEIDRKRREEAERVAREEAERKAREEAARKKQEEEQRKINEINSRTQGAFANSGSGGGGKGNSDGKSQGATFPGGNQGVPTGDPNAGKYGPGGSGSGNQGSGVSYDLGTRTATSMGKIDYPKENDEGKVVVKGTVDKQGKVIRAEPGAFGTTIANMMFQNAAKKAALNTKFSVDENAPALQQGTITYSFSYKE